MIRVTVKGNTYGIKDTLKADGFRWNPQRTAWVKTFKDEDKELVERTGRYQGNGVIVDWKEIKDDGKPKTYHVKEDWLANLESMGDKIWCMIYDVQEGKLGFPFDVAGKKIDSEDDLWDIKEEAAILADKARYGLTGKEYGRARQIVAWRVQVRYNTCLAAGMDEREAGRCFEEM